jgi:hypothetical protein
MMATWRPSVGVEPPAWVRSYVAEDWTSLEAWLVASEGWFDAHPEVDAAHRWEWILSLPDEPWPYGTG